MSLRERSILNWIIYHLGMDRANHTMQSMTGALKGQPQTSMISHLVNVCVGYTQLEGRPRGRVGSFTQTLVKQQVQTTNEEVWSGARWHTVLILCRADVASADQQEINQQQWRSRLAGKKTPKLPGFSVWNGKIWFLSAVHRTAAIAPS